MTKRAYEEARRAHWADTFDDNGIIVVRVTRDVAAAEAAGVTWDEEPTELPEKVYYRGGEIANFREGSSIEAADRHIYANINSTALRVLPKPTAAVLDAICATYNAWGPAGTLRDKLRDILYGTILVNDLTLRELLAEPWKEK